MKTKLLLTLLSLCVGANLLAQSTYETRITTQRDEPIPGASLQLLKTDVYAIADANGELSFKTEAQDFELLINALGYETRRVKVKAGRLPSLIRLSESTAQLDDVVVTALGLERNRQSLAASVAEVDARALVDVPQPNLVNSLAGQVAGVQVTNGSSGVGSSSRIIIRGENSLSGNNQPLFVVDGVPIRNQLISSDLVNDGDLQEVDFGNGAAELNPDDIASISILKGPGSAALYGSRAANGVVLITTKNGRKTAGLGVSTSSSVTAERLLTLPDYQNQYGGGNNGMYSFVDGKGGGVNDGGLSSYGPELDAGLKVQQFDGPSYDAEGNPVRGGDLIARLQADGSLAPITPTDWVSRPDNVRNFFETGFTFQNSVAISGGDDRSALRMSYQNLRNQGVIPNTDLMRDGLALSVDHQLSNKLSIDFYGNYINSRSNNRPNLGYGYENVMYGFNWTGRQANIESMRDYWQAGQEGVQHYDINYLWLTNPYLTVFENTNAFDKNRFLGNLAATYQFTENLSLRLRSGIDRFMEERRFRRAFSTNRKPFGGYREDQVSFNEINTDALLSYRKQLNAELNFEVGIGGNRFDQEISYSFTEADQLAVPGVYSLENSRVPLVGASERFSRRINSLYAMGRMSYQNTWYVDLSVRNDWSSTLPLNNNSFAYYSAGLAWVFSRMLDWPALDFGKLRFSAASVGNDTDPYQLNNTFSFNQNYGSYFRVTNQSVLNNSQLKPERLNSLELGAELWFLNNRLQLDASVYQNSSINQIIGRPISQGSGFSNVIENGGEVRTRGLELRLSAIAIQQGSFRWTSALNFSTYRSKVIRLPEGVSQYVTGTASFFGGDGGANTVFYIAREGGRVGDMYGTGFEEVEGEILHQDGLPVQNNQLRLLGNYNPDFALGWNNELSFNNLRVSFLWDYRHGGTIVSRTKALGSTSGVLKETLEGRETGIIGEGVMNTGTAENPVYEANTVNVPAGAYYNAYYDRGNEASPLYDASYLKLRQLSIYYSLPEKWMKGSFFQEVNLGLLASNLLLFTENPHFDPELNAMQGRQLTYGVDDMSYPSSRSIGLSIKTKF